jgi:hypothetical protein
MRQQQRAGWMNSSSNGCVISTVFVTKALCSSVVLQSVRMEPSISITLG